VLRYGQVMLRPSPRTLCRSCRRKVRRPPVLPRRQRRKRQRICRRTRERSVAIARWTRGGRSGSVAPYFRIFLLSPRARTVRRWTTSPTLLAAYSILRLREALHGQNGFRCHC